MRGVDGALHIAALYKPGIEFRDQMMATNVEGKRHTLEAAIEAGVPKVVYTSAIGVFGNTHRKIDLRHPGAQDLVAGLDG
jgi:dihydroflavonol-4-reductase